MASDDKEIFVIRRDYSGGQNNRIHGSNINENQATVLTNVDISVPGQRKKRPGTTLVEDLSDNPGLGLFGFEPDSGSNLLVAVEGTNLYTWATSGSFTSRKTNFTTSLLNNIIKIGESGIGDVFVSTNGTDNWFRFDPADLNNPQDLGNTNKSPPLSKVGTYYRNRLWVLDDNNLYWSDAFSADYSGAFDRTTDYYKMPVGNERALIGVRDIGIIALGQDQVWGINPSVTPAATDKPEKILDIGCAAGRTAVQVGDDVYFLSHDGIRGVFRTQQDKLQLGASYPLSYVIKEEFDSLNWAQISKATAIYFDNKYFISVPVNASSYNNQVWVYYPASQGWMIISGWNVADWAKVKVDGEERLYYIDSNDGSVFRAWTGYNDNGSAINYVEESKKEDFQKSLQKKVGGVLKIRALSSGDYDIAVYASIDDQEYQLMGYINLSGNSPVLPINLPFTLASNNIIEEIFHLDSLGEWYQIRVKLVHNDTNGSDDIIIYETSIITYLTEFQSE